jgi:hypothetical protein
MNLYFKVLLVLVLGSAFGNPGHPENAVSSSGQKMLFLPLAGGGA